MDRDTADAMVTLAHGLFVHPRGAMIVSEYWFSNYTAQLPAQDIMGSYVRALLLNPLALDFYAHVGSASADGPDITPAAVADGDELEFEYVQRIGLNGHMQFSLPLEHCYRSRLTAVIAALAILQHPTHRAFLSIIPDGPDGTMEASRCTQDSVLRDHADVYAIILASTCIYVREVLARAKDVAFARTLLDTYIRTLGALEITDIRCYGTTGPVAATRSADLLQKLGTLRLLLLKVRGQSMGDAAAVTLIDEWMDYAVTLNQRLEDYRAQRYPYAPVGELLSETL